MKKVNKTGIASITISALALILAALAVWSFTAIHTRSTSLVSQYEAGRWAGDSGTEFSQLSVFIPSTQTLEQKGIYDFRYKMLDAFKEASLDEPETGYLFTDAWSTTDQLSVFTDKAKTTAAVTAVGGDFFSFHQPYLVSGSYISDNDLNNDRVIIDRELAWLLYGSDDLQGMTVYINDTPFIIAGVIDKNTDPEMSGAGTEDPCLFMSFEAYKSLTGKSSISTYEVVMPEVYTGFAMNLFTASFAADKYDIVQNTGRFSVSRIFSSFKTYTGRSARTLSVAYPYWENAARIAEDKNVINLVAGIAAGILSAILLTVAAAGFITARRRKPVPPRDTEQQNFTQDEKTDRRRPAD